MSISERTLRKWRRKALVESRVSPSDGLVIVPEAFYKDTQQSILQMTQILLDQHLLNKGK